MQSLLARLYTDADLRERFLASPQKIGFEHGLNKTEVEQITGILPGELKFFAESLFHKRLREVEKLLPAARKVLDKDFAVLFREFSRQFLPGEIKKHLQDAIEFAGFLRQKRLEPMWLADLIKFEQARLEFNGAAKAFVFRRFNYDIREILLKIEHLDTSAQRSEDSIPKRRAFAVWIRVGKTVRHFIF